MLNQNVTRDENFCTALDRADQARDKMQFIKTVILWDDQGITLGERELTGLAQILEEIDEAVNDVLELCRS